jgi:myosin heavy subunit
VEPTILEAPSAAEIDAFLAQARCKKLEEENRRLNDAINRYKDKCENFENFEKDASQALDERNRARAKASLLKQANDALEQQNNALEEKLAKYKKEYQRKLDEARRELKEEKRLTDEATRTLREKRSLAAESDLQIELLTSKVQQLEALLALEKSRGERMYPPYPIERMHQPLDRMPSFPDGASAMQSMHHPEHRIDYHYASKEHPTKRRAGEGNLRDASDLKLQSEKNKRFCYFGGEKCRQMRKHCDFAHSVNELEVCPRGKRCTTMHCGYMIHSEDERTKLFMSIQSSGKTETLCREYDRNRTCEAGSQCTKIHFPSANLFC